MSASAAPTPISVGRTVDEVRPSFRLHLRAENKAPKTIETYLDALDLFTTYVGDHGMPRDVGAIRREHIEAWLVALQEAGRSPATVNNGVVQQPAHAAHACGNGGGQQGG